MTYQMFKTFTTADTQHSLSLLMKSHTFNLVVTDPPTR